MPAANGVAQRPASDFADIPQPSEIIRKRHTPLITLNTRVIINKLAYERPTIPDKSSHKAPSDGWCFRLAFEAVSPRTKVVDSCANRIGAMGMMDLPIPVPWFVVNPVVACCIVARVRPRPSATRRMIMSGAMDYVSLYVSTVD
jgi:hypothetical protein